MSLSSDNVGYLDISNAILRVGTLDVVGLQGVDTVSNALRANSVLVYDDMGTDIATPPFTIGSGVSRSTSPAEIDLRYASGNNFMYKGIKLPNFFVGEFELYSGDTATGNVFMQTYTESTTSYANDGYELIFDWQYDTITLKYDNTQLAQATSVGLTTSTWHRISVVYDRNVWTISLDGHQKFLLDDSERAAVYENPTTGQYLRFATNSGTSRKVRAIKFMNGSYWSQSKLGHLSYTNGNVGVGTYAPTTHRFEVYGSAKTQSIDATNMALSATTTSTSTSTGALTVAGGIGARESYSGNVYCSNVLTQVSQYSGNNDILTTVRLNEFNDSGSDRWWKLATLTAVNAGVWSYIRGVITMNRVNETQRTYEFSVWGVPTSPDNQFYYGPVNVTGELNFTYHNYLAIYNNTSNNTVDVYLKVSPYSRVKIELDYSNLTTLYLQPNWTTTAPTTSGTYIAKYYTPNSKQSLVSATNKLGVNVTYPSEALHVGGNVRLGNPTGQDDNTDYYIQTPGQLSIRANDTSDTDSNFIYLNLVAGPTSVGSNTAAVQIGSSYDAVVNTFSRNQLVTKQKMNGSTGELYVYGHSLGSNVLATGFGDIYRRYVVGGTEYQGGMHLSGSLVLPGWSGTADTGYNMSLGASSYRWNTLYATVGNFYNATNITGTTTIQQNARNVQTPSGSNYSDLVLSKVVEDSSQAGWLGWSTRLTQVIDSVTMGGIRMNGHDNHRGVTIETGASDQSSPLNLKTCAHFDGDGSVGIGTSDPFNYGYGPYMEKSGGLHVHKDVFSSQGQGFLLGNHTTFSEAQSYGKAYYYAPQAVEPYITAGMLIVNSATNSAGTTANYSQRLLLKSHDHGLWGGNFLDCGLGIDTNGKVSMRRYSYSTPLSKLHIEDNGYSCTVSGTRDSRYTYSYLRMGYPWSVSYSDYCSIIESYNDWHASYNSEFKIYTHTNARTVDGGGDTLSFHARDGRVGLGGALNYTYTVTANAGNGSMYAYAYTVRNTYGENHWREGTGDQATIALHNSRFKVWWGMGWEDYGGTVRHVLNARNGDFTSTATHYAAAFSTASDDRVKDFEKPLHLGTETLLKLNPQHYWKRDKLELSTKVKYREEFGLIAQDVYYDAPELRHLVGLHCDADPSPEKPVRDENIQIDPLYDNWGSQVASLEIEGLIPVMINSFKEIVTEKDAVKTRVTDVAFSNVADHRGLVVCARDDAFSPKSGKPLVELSSRVGCKAWYGVIAHANVHTEDSETLISRGGDAKVWVLMREGASVETGDLLCTSNIHGYAWTQSDDLMRSSTVAKLTQGCDFTVPVPRPKKKIRRELRDVTYYIKRRWYKTCKEEYDSMPEDKKRTYLEDYYEKTEYEYRPSNPNMKRDDDDQWNGPVVYVKTLKYTISKETYQTLSPEAQEPYKPSSESEYARLETQTATQEAYDLMTEEERKDYQEHQSKPNPTEKTVDEWEALEADEKEQYVLKSRRVWQRMEQWVSKDPLITNTTVETKQEMVDVLDEHGQRIYDDDPEETELPYEIRYISDTQGTLTTRHNAVYYAALLSCTLMG
jgi:hypothetical protein